MEIYIGGCLISVFVVIPRFIWKCFKLLSTESINYAKVNRYLDFNKKEFVDSDKENDSIFENIVGELFVAGFAILLSWATILFTIIIFFSKKDKRIRSQQVEKELSKLKTNKVSKHEVEMLLTKVTSIEDNERNERIKQSKLNDPNRIYKEEDGYIWDIQIYPNEFKYDRTFSSTDYLDCTTEYYEYKIDNDGSIKSRLLRNHSRRDTIDTPNFVEDGVVLEQNIIEDCNKSEFCLIDSEEEITSYKKLVEWQSMDNIELKYLLLSKHPHLIKESEVRRLARQEYEDLKLSVIKYLNFFYESRDENKIEIYDTEYGIAIKAINKKMEEFQKILSKFEESQMIKFEDVRHYKSKMYILSKFLDIDNFHPTFNFDKDE